MVKVLEYEYSVFSLDYTISMAMVLKYKYTVLSLDYTISMAKVLKTWREIWITLTLIVLRPLNNSEDFVMD
jgi:hypothetical protein